MTKTLTIALAALTLSACAAQAADDAQPGQDNLKSRLGARETLALERTSSVHMGVRETDAAMDNMSPSVLGGHTTMRATSDGFVIVEALSIDLSDVSIDKQWPSPHTVELTAIQLRLGSHLAIDAEWVGDRATGVGRADLLMDWAMRTDDGEILPLATQRARDVELTVDVRMAADGTISGNVTASVAGQIWRFTGIEVHDLALVLNASTSAPL